MKPTLVFNPETMRFETGEAPAPAKKVSKGSSDLKSMSREQLISECLRLDKIFTLYDLSTPRVHWEGEAVWVDYRGKIATAHRNASADDIPENILIKLAQNSRRRINPFVKRVDAILEAHPSLVAELVFTDQGGDKAMLINGIYTEKLREAESIFKGVSLEYGVSFEFNAPIQTKRRDSIYCHTHIGNRVSIDFRKYSSMGFRDRLSIIENFDYIMGELRKQRASFKP